MDTYDLFKQLVPPGSILQSSEGGFAVRTRNDDGFSNSFVSDADLLTVDARLPTALRIFEQEVTPIESIFVSHILQLWSTNSHVQTTSGQLYGVCQVQNLVFTDSTVNIRSYGYMYGVHTSPVSGEDLILPTGPGPVIAEISKDWLNQHRPGWQTRYQLACDLDMSVEEAFNAMVSTSRFDIDIQLPSITLSS